MGKLEIIQGDITNIKVDAIVNAANSSLMGGGGVDGAIHAAAGPKLKEACMSLAPCPTSEVRVTPGFNIPVKYIIHTVGPIWQGGKNKESESLTLCYQNSLYLAQRLELKTIAFPSISTGAYNFPLRLAAPITIKAIKEFLHNNLLPEAVYLVCYDERTKVAYEEALVSFNFN